MFVDDLENKREMKRKMRMMMMLIRPENKYEYFELITKKRD
jgi:hypothetical protein